MQIEFYQSSKGPRRIADMAYPHLANAIRNLQGAVDNGWADDRRDELAAMIRRRDEMDAAYRAQTELVS